MPETPDPMEGVPQSGRDRLEVNKAGLFTSDLSISEYLLLEDAGYEPLGLVLGTSIYHIGYQRRGGLTGHELEVLSKALYHARELAMTRMEEEARDLDADGIVAVRLTVKGFESRGHTAEFVAVGTAVRKRDGPRPERRPFTSDLSGQDFWMLLRTGARPVGLVMGSCVYAMGPAITTLPATLRNAERAGLTQAFYDARELAMGRMQQEAVALNANGIVGVDLHDHQHGWGGRIVEFFAVGTAIIKDGASHSIAAPSTVIDLNR